MEEGHKKFLGIAIHTLGAGVGGAIGFLGGLPLAVGGAIAGVAVTETLKEFATRSLSSREELRVVAVAHLTVNGIKNRIERGQLPRNDDFFKGTQYERSNANELFEGILIKCKNEYEEKKISFVAKIFENVAFDSSISPENANQILNITGQLSFRQLTLLSFIGQNKDNTFGVRMLDYEEGVNIHKDIQFLLQDLHHLCLQGLIYRKDNTFSMNYEDNVAGQMILSDLGIEYFNLLNLSEMSKDEFSFITLLR